MSTRTSPRSNCLLPCRLLAGATQVDGTVLNVSARGLLVRASGAFEEGDAFTVRVDAGEGAPLELETMVWHSRPADDGSAKESLVGLVVSVDTEDFERLRARIQP